MHQARMSFMRVDLAVVRMKANADLIGFVRQTFPGKELSVRIEFA